jgi:hypothetical protein
MNDCRDLTAGIYPELWEDFEGLAQNLFSFASMEKVQQAMNLRSLTIHTEVMSPRCLSELIDMAHNHYPLLEELIVLDKKHVPGRHDINFLAQMFAGKRGVQFKLAQQNVGSKLFHIVGFDCEWQLIKGTKKVEKHFRVILQMPSLIS